MLKKYKKSEEAVSADQESITVSGESGPSGQPDQAISSKSSFVIRRKPCEKEMKILQETDPAQLLRDYPALESVKEVQTINSPFLYISGQAEAEIKEHISWNQKTEFNVYEQGGILIGRPFLVNQSVLGIVEHVIPAESGRANSAYLEMDTGAWAKMLEIYDNKYKDKGMFVMGWFHTHPNNLSVFMSSTDRKTQREFFNQDWHFAVVLNPHRRLLACFHSANADKCDCYPSDFADP